KCLPIDVFSFHPRGAQNLIFFYTTYIDTHTDHDAPAFPTFVLLIPAANPCLRGPTGAARSRCAGGAAGSLYKNVKYHKNDNFAFSNANHYQQRWQAAIAARKPYTFAGKTGAVITSNHYNTKNNIDKLFTPNDTPVRPR
ncbi:hypothetical protein J4732_21360, partial [Serratia marcescens]|nr:hypothetical protein [Serratia marcescens]